jgi:hypothetical protein
LKVGAGAEKNSFGSATLHKTVPQVMLISALFGKNICLKNSNKKPLWKVSFNPNQLS